MRKIKLKNGLTIIYDKQPTKSVSIQVTVKVGSNHETKKNNGISHFIEHMLFEGTKTRSNQEIANEIERLGGELNAATTAERTYYYVKILNKYFDKALDILSDLTQNPNFDIKAMEKEKKVILNEINLVNDEPRFYQWILLQRTLFDSNARLPTYGDKDVVKKLKQDVVLSYYNHHYTANNVVISIVGNIENPINQIKKKFNKLKHRKLKKIILKESKNKFKKIIEKKKTNQTYILLGYKVPNRNSKESYVFDILHAILGRGQSGRLFDEIREKRGLAYEVGVQHESGVDISLFAVYVSTTNKKKINEIITIILNEFDKLKKINSKTLNEAKTYIEGNFALENEDTKEKSDLIAFWELVSKAEDVNNYITRIKKVTINDVKDVVKKYLNKDYTLAILEPT